MYKEIVSNHESGMKAVLRRIGSREFMFTLIDAKAHAVFGRYSGYSSYDEARADAVEAISA